MSKREYNVILPIAGHAYVTVEAESEEEAIEKAFEVEKFDEIEWEMLEQFNRGNVCYCPSPWEAVADAVDGDEDENLNAG